MPDLPPVSDGSAPETRLLRIGGTVITPLPATRVEVEGIVRAWGPFAAAFLGEEATEERAVERSRDSDLLHFACHGLLDERLPLNAGLMLTVPPGDAPGRENGFLQAWEVFDRVRCDADLVVLSACATALGKASGGEGLVGLTRAFEYAGARSVLSTLWRIDDRSTARWMERFYTHLKAGLSKDEAVRRTQVAFIRGLAPSSAAPFFWAAFQLDGDWK
jgi:CHAT domain-containing protein